MEEWAARWRQRTELQLFQEVWAMEFGQEEWEARARRRQADEEVRRVAAQGRAVRGVTRLLREAELKVRAPGGLRACAAAAPRPRLTRTPSLRPQQCREDFLAELARRAQSWITEDTLDARIAHALAHPEPLRSARERLAPLRIAAPRMAIVDELDASDVAKPRADRRALLRAEVSARALQPRCAGDAARVRTSLLQPLVALAAGTQGEAGCDGPFQDQLDGHGG